MQQIVDRFNKNLDRAANMVTIYENHISRSGSGRRPAKDTDLLRASLVFAHAALEDFLRSISIEKLPQQPAEKISEIPLAGSNEKNATKFRLDALVPFRNLTVQQLIEKSVEEHQSRWLSINNFGDVKSAVGLLGIDPETLTYGEIQGAIARRHRIVHHADASEAQGGQGNHRIASITPNFIRTYLTDLRNMLVQLQPHLN